MSEFDTGQVARDSAYRQASSPRPEEPVLQLLHHATSPEPQLTQTVWRSACVNRHRVTASTHHKPQRSFRALYSRPAGH